MKIRITAVILGLAAATGLPSGAFAQAKPEPRSPKIAVIDMARVSSESLLGKGYAARIDGLKNEIEAERTKKQNDLTKMDASLKALQEEVEKQQAVLSPEALEKKRQDLIKKGRDRQAYLEDGQQELQRLQEQAQQRAQALNSEFQIKIKPHIEAVAKEKGIDILLDSQVTLTVSKEYDISVDVIVKADEAEKVARAKPAAAAPKPQAPAAAPAPSPTPSPSSQR